VVAVPGVFARHTVATATNYRGNTYVGSSVTQQWMLIRPLDTNYQ
jgi:hypothetical protein